MKEVEIIFDLGVSDRCHLIILKRNKNNKLEIIDVYSETGKNIYHYIEYLNNLFEKCKFKCVDVHLPKDAYMRMISGETAAEILNNHGYKEKVNLK